LFNFSCLSLFSIRPIISLQQQQKQLSTNQQGKGNRASSSKHPTNAAVSHRSNKKNEMYGYEESIPTCRHCGTHLRFELQILSSILHVLNVDDFGVEDTTTTSGGMDWGNICVYTCPNQVSKCLSNDVFCIVQDSIDHVYLPNNNGNSTNNTILHQQQQSATSTVAAVVIPENTQFDQDDDDDGIVLVGDEYENECDDDDSVW
jgi:Programmed cell death protein 2, C-terminal putative domain